MSKVFIIAEAGVNHNGSMDLAKKLVDVAVEAGADAVKFQTFIAEKVMSKHAKKAEYQVQNTGAEQESQLDMVKKLQLSFDDFKELQKYCVQKKIMFLSTPFDPVSIDFLAGRDLDLMKIPSGEITNLPYLKKVGALGKKVVISTGMADMGEIEDALDVLVSAGTPKDKITVLHCNTEYPTPMSDVNLLAMLTIRDAFKVNIGYSDHTLGIEVPVAAVALGATMIEKHFTLDKTMEGPDHVASLDPLELKAMVAAIRNIEVALGDGIKKPSASEKKNKEIARKSIHAGKDLVKGQVIGEEDLEVKRPGNGISSMLMNLVVGKKLLRDVKYDEMLTWQDLQ